MIARYNRAQITLALLALVCGLICCFLAWLFFRFLPVLILDSVGFKTPPWGAVLMGWLGLSAVIGSGYRNWKARGGLYSYHESALYHELDSRTGGAAMLDFYTHRVTGPAYIISQVLLAGPTMLFRARTLVASLVPNTPERESKLSATLEVLRAADKWQPLSEYPDSEIEIYYLARMGLIDFAPNKGNPRIKACVEQDGV